MSLQEFGSPLQGPKYTPTPDTPLTSSSVTSAASASRTNNEERLYALANTPSEEESSSELLDKPGSSWKKEFAEGFESIKESFQENKKEAIGGGILTACTFPFCVIGGAIGGLLGLANAFRTAIKQDHDDSKEAKKPMEYSSNVNELFYQATQRANRQRRSKESFFERHGDHLSREAKVGAAMGATVGSLGGFYLLYQALFGNKMETLS